MCVTHCPRSRRSDSVLNSDIAIMLSTVVLVPYLDVILPTWLIVLLGCTALSLLGFALQPILRISWLVWVSAWVRVGSDVTAFLFQGSTSSVFLGINNLRLTLMVGRTHDGAIPYQEHDAPTPVSLWDFNPHPQHFHEDQQ